MGKVKNFKTNEEFTKEDINTILSLLSLLSDSLTETVDVILDEIKTCKYHELKELSKDFDIYMNDLKVCNSFQARLNYYYIEKFLLGGNDNEMSR